MSIEEIRQKPEKARDLIRRNRAAWSGGGCAFSVYADRLLDFSDDLDMLLERVGELEAENEALHTALKASGERRERLEAENRRLRDALEHLARQTEVKRLESYPPSFIVSLNSVARRGLQPIHPQPE